MRILEEIFYVAIVVRNLSKISLGATIYNQHHVSLISGVVPISGSLLYLPLIVSPFFPAAYVKPTLFGTPLGRSRSNCMNKNQQYCGTNIAIRYN